MPRPQQLWVHKSPSLYMHGLQGIGCAHLSADPSWVTVRVKGHEQVSMLHVGLKVFQET